MNADGLAGASLYVTEVGWTTHGSSLRDSATAAARPGYISETVSTLAHSDCGIAGVMLYTWTTLERNPANPQDWFGISPPGAGPSADTAAFTSALQAAEVPAPPALLCTTNQALVDRRVLPPAQQKRTLRPSGARAWKRGARPQRRRCTRAARRHHRCQAAKRRA